MTRSVSKRAPLLLRRGDLIAVVAPGAAVDEDRLAAGVGFLERSGFRVRLGSAVRRRQGYLAGSDRERADDLHAAFADPEVRAILTARGGYGCGRLYSLLDRPLIRAHPKIFVGHSDISFLLNHFSQELDLITFHGPMVLNLPEQLIGREALLAMLSRERMGWQMNAREIIQPGTAEGRLAGGCLSIVCAALATPWSVDTRGTLLFLEEVNEKPFRVDRMLTQLWQAGAFDEVAGVVFGEMAGCTAGENERTTVRDVIAESFAHVNFPVVFGVPSGHGSGECTLPLGVHARLAGERLTLLESPVVGREGVR